MTEKLLLTVAEAAELLSIGRTKAYEEIAADRLAAVRVGRSRRIPRDALSEYVESLRTAERAEP